MATARRPPDTAYQRALRRARQLGPNATIEPHDAHHDGGRRHYHVVRNGQPAPGAVFPFGSPVRRGAPAFEDAAQAEAESLGDLVHQITQAFPTSAIPGDVKRDLVTQARMIYSVRGALLARLMATVYALIRTRNLPPPVALQVGARQLGLRPSPAPPGARGRLSDPQVRQYHRRQAQRGRRPGQNPQMRSRMQREAEALFEAPAPPPRTRAEAELEAMLRRVDRAISAPRPRHGPDFLIGDPANPPNDGRDPNPYHDRVLARVIRHMQQLGWRDIRREQTQVAGGARRPVEATQPSQAPLPGLNFPDGSGIDRRSRRTHIEIDTDPRASLDHQARIFAADSNPALGPLARRSRGVFVVIDPQTGRVTSVRHVRHDPRGGQPIVRETRYAGRGMPIQNLLTLGLLNRPVAPRTAQQPLTRRRRSTAGLPGHRQQRESERAGLAYV